jgi:phosphatidylglycerol---prolipoprotein diacylglyceryl transferase
MFHLYGFFIGLAIVVGYSVAEKLEPRIVKIAPWVIGFGIVGARLYHVIDLWEFYSQNPQLIVAVWNGGMSIWGALLGGLFAWLLVGRGSWELLGASAVALPLAQAIGRIGNGVNGEFTNLVFGIPWWSAEAILDLFLFTILWSRRGQSPQVKMVIYLVGYGLIRAILQPYR